MKHSLLRFLTIGLLSLSSFALGAFLTKKWDSPPITKEAIRGIETIFGLSYTETERDSLLNRLTQQQELYQANRQISLPNQLAPALSFDPILPGMKFDRQRKPFQTSKISSVRLPENREELAFYSVGELAQLLRSRKLTSLELTQLYLQRLKQYGPKLECVITLTEELALAQAKKADAEIKAGKYRGPMHGIPYGAKDLLAKKGYQTTWGSVLYKDQIITEDATVISKLEEAGAVLVAKLTLGELASGDIWWLCCMTRS